jgi:hypothetical protein
MDFCQFHPTGWRASKSSQLTNLFDGFLSILRMLKDRQQLLLGMNTPEIWDFAIMTGECDTKGLHNFRKILIFERMIPGNP